MGPSLLLQLVKNKIIKLKKLCIIYKKDIQGFFVSKKVKIIMGAILFVEAFFVGVGIGVIKDKITQEESVVVSNNGNWGLGFGAEGTKPTGSESAEVLKEYDAYYIAQGDEKKLYLTFDCGYENGNTPAILEALKKHKAPATFFVVGHFINENEDLIKQMVKEGHTVGNHTYSHPDITGMNSESFEQELKKVSDKYTEITGKEMTKFYRAPQGKLSLDNLKIAKSLGYKTFFWSLAYVDWNVDNQPTKEEAFDKLLSRVHPGAIVLLHNTSKTNGEILDELLGKWEDMGYKFGKLQDIE